MPTFETELRRIWNGQRRETIQGEHAESPAEFCQHVVLPTLKQVQRFAISEYSEIWYNGDREQYGLKLLWDLDSGDVPHPWRHMLSADVFRTGFVTLAGSEQQGFGCKTFVLPAEENNYQLEILRLLETPAATHGFFETPRGWNKLGG